MDNVRIFQMNDCDWVAAHSPEEAHALYLDETGVDEDEIRALPDWEVDTLKFHDPDGEWTGRQGTMTFREALAGMLSMDEWKPPFLFCSTEG
jgi:hypothetical protein